MVPSASRVGLLAIVLLGTGALPVGAAEPALPRELLKLNQVTGNDVIDAQVALLIQGGDHTRALLKRAAALARKKTAPFNYNALYILAHTAHELQEVGAAEVFYRLGFAEAHQLRSGQRMVQALGGLIDLYDENQLFDRTAKVCRAFLAIEGNDTVNRLKLAVMERLIQSLTRLHQIDEALKLVDVMVEAEDEDGGWGFLQLKGWVLHEGERLDEAAQTYESVLERIHDDETLGKDEKHELAHRVRYLLSDIYAELNQVDRAAEQLQALLKERPDDPDYNNDLGYLWADHDQNLEKAEQLIRKAIAEDRKRRQADPDLDSEEEQDAAAFLDSLGWVLYKQKKYEEAKKCLLEAVAGQGGKDVETLEHLGDVLRALGETEEAKKIYREALDAVGSSKREQHHKTEVEHKLQMLDD